MYYRREVGEIGRICEVDTLDFREVDTNLSNMNKYLYWHVLWEVGRPSLRLSEVGWPRRVVWVGGCVLGEVEL